MLKFLLGLFLVFDMRNMDLGFGFGLINLFPYFFLFCAIAGSTDNGGTGNMSTGFQPSLAVVMGVVAIMFVLTFLLLVYAKYCHRTPSELTTDDADDQRGLGFGFGLGLGELRAATSRRFSGIDKTVIESLPFFRFSSLKGTREGLECAVCLSKFEDIEILRLVPKCKHAFHIECVDRWLENHSSCPLCRHKVDPSDFTIFTYSNSLRISRNPSDLTDDPNLELFVRREQDIGSSSSRFRIGGSFRKLGEELPIQEEQSVAIHGEDDDDDDDDDGDGDDRKLLHKFKHMIIVSDVVCKNRWSDVDSSDLMLLNSEMLREMSSRRFDSSASSSERFTSAMSSSDNGLIDQRIIKIKEEMERKRVFESKFGKITTSYSFSNSNFPSTSTSASASASASGFASEVNPGNPPGRLVPSGVRSVSETSFARFPDHIKRNRIKESFHHGGKDEKVRKVWIPIAKRTVQWFAGREQRSKQQQSHSQSDQTSNV
ncbi:E3 ubiquitin-protein ligase ATL42-like [Macadamia integrifolia]|uniref:E3 ubiquitin-protein ligase ATL42-like n=1 Tax=Macadamia integrifolia TaxID=60698 RepID=UPI001C4EB952|nr:E3 ubiquitin-protein ligase ATL42-like [Macadamia integrifolia]